MMAFRMDWETPFPIVSTDLVMSASFCRSTGAACLNTIRVFDIPKTFRFVFQSDSAVS